MEAKTPRTDGHAAPATAIEPEVFLALLDHGDPEQILERVLTLLTGPLGLDWAGLVVRDGAGGRLGPSWERRGEGPGILAREPDALQPVILFDLPVGAEEASLPVDWAQPLTQRLAARGMTRVLFTPLCTSRTAGATLLVAQRAAGVVRPRGLALLQTVAAPLGRALAAAERALTLERSVADRTRELAALYEISRAAGTTLHYEDLLQVVMGSLHALTEFDMAAVIVDLAGLRDLSIHTGRPASDEARIEAAEAARAAFLQLAGHPAADAPPRLVPLDAHEPDAPPIHGRLASRESAPLMRRGAVVGAIVILARGDGAFPEARARLLHTIAAQASLSLDRLRTVQEEEEGRLQSLIDSMPHGVIMTDLDLRVAYTNRSGRRTLEILTGEPSPRTLDRLGTVRLADIARPVLRDGLPAAAAEVTIGDPYRVYALTVSPVAAPGPGARAPSGIVLVVSDITEARLIQEQLLQSEKLSAIGEMISGVAHELNNPLASVMGFAQILQSAPVSDDVKRKLQIVLSESQRCQRVVQNLLSFARKHRPERSPVDLNAALNSVLSLLAYQLRVDGIAVKTQLDPGIPAVMGDFHLLQQVFLNLINNAHQAMREQGGDGGTLEVTSLWLAPATARRRAGAEREDADQERKTGPGRTPDGGDGIAGGRIAGGGIIGGGVRVEVRDTGPGISPENLKRIFDPFFTTKKTGEGTGLGLSLAYGAISEHGGRIYARSQLGRGTTFVVDLPKGVHAASAAREPEARSAAPVAPSRILVVEDEIALAQLLAESLGADGHRVETAANGIEALERLGSACYDVVISDLKMPCMDGRQLYEEVRRRDPALAARMIFSTGDVASARTQDFIQATGAPLIVKPFDLREVHDAVATVLGKQA